VEVEARLQSLLVSTIVCAEGCYLLFDCPGQVELFTLHDSLLTILAVMDKQWHFRRGSTSAGALPPAAWGAHSMRCLQHMGLLCKFASQVCDREERCAPARGITIPSHQPPHHLHQLVALLQFRRYSRVGHTAVLAMLRRSGPAALLAAMDPARRSSP